MVSPDDAQRAAARVALRASAGAQIERDIAVLRPRYGALFQEIVRDLDELRTTGTIERARNLVRGTGQHFNHSELPDYFFGDLDADLVLVHLNPKQANSLAEAFPPQLVPSFEEYFNAHRHFGSRAYGPSSPRKHTSRFDHKQIRFLRPFGVIRFVDEHTAEDRFTNLQRAIDDKLQLELIPYGSDTFSASGFARTLLKPHFDRVLHAITRRERRYVLFCGAVFERLLKPHVVDEHRFALTKADGSRTRQMARFANVRLPYRGRTIGAGLASSWARQGIPMESYAEAVRARYWPDGSTGT